MDAVSPETARECVPLCACTSETLPRAVPSLQDNNGACLIRTINAMPTAVAVPIRYSERRSKQTTVTEQCRRPPPQQRSRWSRSRSWPSGNNYSSVQTVMATAMAT